MLLFALVPGLALVAVHWAGANQPNTEPARAIAAIEGLGGRVTLDRTAPGEPAVFVDFSRTKVSDPQPKVTDAGLAYLQGVPQLQSLDLASCRQITDAGLAHLRGLTQLKTLNVDGARITDSGLVHVRPPETYVAPGFGLKPGGIVQNGAPPPRAGGQTLAAPPQPVASQPSGGPPSGKRLPASVAQMPVAEPQPTPSESLENERPQLLLDLQGFAGLVTGLAFSPDGSLLAAAGDKEVRLWSVAGGELLATLRGQQGRDARGRANAVAFSPDGRHLVVGVDDYSDAGSLRVYETGRWTEIQQLLAGHRAPVKRLAFTRDGRYLASAGDNGRILFWQWSTRAIVGSALPRDPGQPLYQGFLFAVRDPLLSVYEVGGPSVISVPEGKRLAPADCSAESLRRFPNVLGQALFPDKGSPSALDARLDQGVWLAGGASKPQGMDRYWVGFWRVARPEPSRVYEGHRYVVTAVAMDASATLAASADAFGEVHVWDLQTGQARHVFRSLGKQVYRAALDVATRRIAFGTTPFPPDRWGHNRFGALETTFQLGPRKIVSGAAGTYPAECVEFSGAALQPVAEDDGTLIDYVAQGTPRSRYRVRAGAALACYSLLRGPRLGIESPVVFGDDSGGLLCYDGRTGRERRDFAGHGLFVTSLSESADGRFLTTSSTDRTVRVWSLENYRSTGDLDFKHLSDVVIEVRPNGPGALGGVKLGDRLLAMDGKGLAELLRRRLEGTYDYRPGQRVRVAMQRGGKPYHTELTLEEGADLVEPLLNLFVVDENDWILWTPQGYYDASPGGDRLVGWHVNQGPSRSAKFYSVHQFRKQSYRPDVIDLVFQTGSVEEAVRRADAARPSASPAPDLRQPEALHKLEPPRVRILAPAEGAQSQSPQVFVLAEVQSQNDLPLTEVNVLVNGRPAHAKGVHVEAAQGGLRTSLSRQVTLLPGANAISIVAANAASTSQPATVNVVYQPAQPVVARPDLYLLAIGISQYARRDLNLQYAHLDAQAFAAAWKSQEGPVYGRMQTRLVINEEATVGNILGSMDWLVKNVTQRDVAVVFISAHGMRDSRQNYYLASHQIDPASLRSTAVRFSEVKELLRDLPCKVLLFVDTCHSGGITGARAVWDDPLQDLVAEEFGAVVFSSSLPREVSLEDARWGHGAFTRALLDALAPASDSNGDGYLSLSELEQQVYQRVKQLTQGRQHAVVERPPTIRDFSFFYVGKK